MKYYIIAGEASGDLHGSNLMKAIFKKWLSLHWWNLIPKSTIFPPSPLPQSFHTLSFLLTLKDGVLSSRSGE